MPPRKRTYRRRRKRFKKKRRSYANQIKGFGKPSGDQMITRTFNAGEDKLELPTTDVPLSPFFYRGISTNFSIASCPEATTMLRYHRFYRIVGMKLTFLNETPKKFISYSDASDSNAYYSQIQMCVIPDREGSTETCASVNDWNAMKDNRQKKLRSINEGQRFSVAIRPNILGLLYEGTVNMAYTPLYNKWIRNDDLDVSHYGFRTGVQWKSRSPMEIRIVASMIVQFKEPCLDLKLKLSDSVVNTRIHFDHTEEDDCVTHTERTQCGAVLVTDDDDVIETDQHVANAPGGGVHDTYDP